MANHSFYLNCKLSSPISKQCEKSTLYFAAPNAHDWKNRSWKQSSIQTWKTRWWAYQWKWYMPQLVFSFNLPMEHFALVQSHFLLSRCLIWAPMTTHDLRIYKVTGEIKRRDVSRIFLISGTPLISGLETRGRIQPKYSNGVNKDWLAGGKISLDMVWQLHNFFIFSNTFYVYFDALQKIVFVFVIWSKCSCKGIAHINGNERTAKKKKAEFWCQNFINWGVRLFFISFSSSFALSGQT